MITAYYYIIKTDKIVIIRYIQCDRYARSRYPWPRQSMMVPSAAVAVGALAPMVANTEAGYLSLYMSRQSEAAVHRYWLGQGVCSDIVAYKQSLLISPCYRDTCQRWFRGQELIELYAFIIRKPACCTRVLMSWVICYPELNNSVLVWTTSCMFDDCWPTENRGDEQDKPQSTLSLFLLQLLCLRVAIIILSRQLFGCIDNYLHSFCHTRCSPRYLHCSERHSRR